MTTGRYPKAPAPASPHFPAIQDHCLGFEGAWEDYPWGETVYKVGAKLFAMTGGTGPLHVTVKARPDDADALCQMPGIARAAYIGRYGWITLSVASAEAAEFARDLIAVSYSLVARPAKRGGPRTAR